MVGPCLAGLLKPSLGLQALGLLRPAPLWLFGVVPLEPLVSRALDTVVLPLRDHQVAMGVLTFTGMNGQRIRQADFFDQAHKWLADKYGADRIITATVHRDETSPHLSAFVVPLTADGRLSAKDFIGNRSKMTADQTSFAKAVQHLGLERGIERSRATHTSIKQHYAAIERGIKNQVEISPEALEPRAYKREGLAEKLRLTTRVESTEAVAARLSASVNEGFAGTIANAAESAQNARRAREIQKTMVDQQKKLKTLQEPFKGLSREQVAEVIKMATTMQRENEAAKAAKLQHQKEQRQQQRSKNRGNDSASGTARHLMA